MMLAAETNPYALAGIALLGTLIGGGIAAWSNLSLARRTRDENRHQWIRDQRATLYDRYLSEGQGVLVACVNRGMLSHERSAPRIDTSKLMGIYAVVQILASKPVVDAARIYGYRILALERLGLRGNVDETSFDEIGQLVRAARHDTIEAMRAELELPGSARPDDGFDEFRGTEFQGKSARL
jgi:hypothetical protein